MVRPILEYEAACWDPYREGQKRELDRGQRKAAKSAYHINIPEWETLESRKKIARIGALYKAFSGERAWMGIGNTLKRPHYLRRADHKHKIRSRRQKTDIGKYLFVNRTTEDWNQLPAYVLDKLPRCSTTFRKRLRKAISEGQTSKYKDEGVSGV